MTVVLTVVLLAVIIIAAIIAAIIVVAVLIVCGDLKYIIIYNCLIKCAPGENNICRIFDEQEISDG